nr:random slug protein 5-like [Ipomoea batatas]
MEREMETEQNESQKVEEAENAGFSELERNKIQLMKAHLHKQDPSFVEVDDYTMRRFLQARNLDIEKASIMLLKYLKWRHTFVEKGYISPSEVSNEIAQNKVFVQGVDKQGRPIVVVFGGRHLQIKDGFEEFKRFVVFALDKVCARLLAGNEEFMTILDLQGYGYSNSDARGYIGVLSILQDYYPERLGKCLIIHVPYVFWALYKIMYPFINNNTRNKIMFVDNRVLTSTLLEFIDERQLPDLYGGKQPLVPIHNCEHPRQQQPQNSS